MAGGGGTSTGGVYTVTGTFGQQDAGGSISGGGYTVTFGFWSLLGQGAPALIPTVPIITSQPQSLFVTNGAPAALNVTVSGTPPLFYQWQKNGVNLYDGGNISGSTNANLLLSTTTTNDGGSYSVVIQNAYGNVTNSSVAKLTLVLRQQGGYNGNVVYLRSTIGEPWNSTDNDQILTEVFGVWLDWRYETVNVSSLLSSSNAFIFIEGSDDNALAMGAFLTNNLTAIQNWVTAGGSLFINAAPNQGGSQYLGFGVNLTYPDFCRSVQSAYQTHPIFKEPYLPVGTAFSGDYFSHASVLGAGLTVLLTNDTSGNFVLAEKNYGAGHVIFGGMTLPHYHSPQPQGSNLLANIFSYAANLAVNRTGNISFPPKFQTMFATGGTLQFSWNAVITYPAVGYQVQYTTNLVSGPWVNLGGVQTTTSFTTGTGTDAQRFYRVQLVQ